ncbi:MAG TPA: ABC transporter ATP-binding protein [Candidatus Dormibacteraeota bacterium]
MATDPVVESQGLSKDYGSGRGLFDLDLTMTRESVFGYLGPNGAGKTTTIKLLMAMIRPTRGTARIFGLDCQKDAVAIKRKVGYLPAELPQFGGLRGSEVVAYLAGLRGGVDKGRVRSLAERLEVDLGRRFREYSSGNKKKLGIVLAFMHAPELLILDEPTGGLDPLIQQEFYRLLGETRANGATIFLSSHVLSEVEHVCDRVGILRLGRLIRVAELEELRDIHFHKVEMVFESLPPLERLAKVHGLEQLVRQGNRVSFTLHGDFEGLLKAVAGSKVVNLSSHEPSLEEVFLAYYREDQQPAATAAAVQA